MKYFGEKKNGKKIGDWYFFNKKGELVKHIYYEDNGDKRKMPILQKHKPKNIARTKQTFNEFVDSLKKKINKNRKLVTGKNFSYETVDGKKNGYFVYSYRNKVNIAGWHTHNMKTGTWCMWNTKNQLLLQREYNLGFEYETIYSIAPRNKLTGLLDHSQYVLQRNDQGYYNYPYLEENDMTW